MRTSALIKLLQEADPNDECQVCISNHPVKNVDRMPYYYDGRLEFVERDEHHEPIKIGYRAGGHKIKIQYDTLEDALIEKPDVELDLTGITYNGKVNESYMVSIREWQKEGREYQEWLKNFNATKDNVKEAPVPQVKLNWKQRLRNWINRK